MSSRAIRRHHIERLKKARKNYFNGDLDERELGKVVSTPKPCSCHMCVNERKVSGVKTIQERRAELDYK